LIRFVLVDAQWALIEPHCLARHPTSVKPDATYVFSSKPFFGLFEPVRSGGKYRMSLASGTQSLRGSADG